MRMIIALLSVACARRVLARKSKFSRRGGDSDKGRAPRLAETSKSAPAELENAEKQ